MALKAVNTGVIWASVKAETIAYNRIRLVCDGDSISFSSSPGLTRSLSRSAGKNSSAIALLSSVNSIFLPGCAFQTVSRETFSAAMNSARFAALVARLQLTSACVQLPMMEAEIKVLRTSINEAR